MNNVVKYDFVNRREINNPELDLHIEIVKLDVMRELDRSENFAILDDLMQRRYGDVDYLINYYSTKLKAEIILHVKPI